MGSSPIKKNKKVKTKKHVKKEKAQSLSNTTILTEIEEVKNIKRRNSTPLEMSLEEPETHASKKRRGSVPIKKENKAKKENGTVHNKKSDQKVNVSTKKVSKANIPIKLNVSSDTGSKTAIGVDSGNLQASSNDIGEHLENNNKSEDILGVNSVISPKMQIVSNLTSDGPNLQSEEVDELVYSESNELVEDSHTSHGTQPAYSSVQMGKKRGKFTFATDSASRRAKSVLKKLDIFTEEDGEPETDKPTNIASTKHIFTESAIDDEPLYVVSDEDGEAMIVNETELYGSRSVTKYKNQWVCSECTGHVSDDDSEQMDDSDDSNDEDFLPPMYEKTSPVQEEPENLEAPEPVPVEKKKTWKEHFFSLTVLHKQKKYALILKKLTHLYSPDMIERNSYDNCFITPYNDEVTQKYKTDIRVNASFVKTDHRTFIAASYPNRAYHEVFNEMTAIACDLIVSLTNEGDEYFIPDPENGIIEENEIYKIEKRGNVTRIKFLKWEDYSVPNITEFLVFYNKYLEIITERPVLVHCKAGVGRTGTFILFDILKRKEKITEKILLEELCKLRSQRNYLVHNEVQFKWIIAQFDIQ